jgi:hypothetical protein
MAVDPRIALMGKPLDLGQTFNTILSNIGQAQQLQQSARLAPMQEQAAQMEMQAQLNEQARSREAQRAQSLYQGAQEIQPMVTSAMKTNDWSGVRNHLLNRRERLIQAKADGAQVDTLETDQAIALLDQDPQAFVQSIGQVIQFGDKAFGRSGPVTDFDKKISLLQDPNATEDQRQAARIATGLEAPRGRAQTVEIAGVPFVFDPNAKTFEGVTADGEKITASSVAEAKKLIAESTERGKAEGAQAVKEIGEAGKKIGSFDRGISIANRVVELIDSGATTGTIQSIGPSFKAATVELQQLLGEETLNRLSQVTLGAISEAELELLKQVAIPTNMQPEALKDYMQRKAVAMEKARKVYLDKVEFLNNGGTLAEFINRGSQRKIGKFEILSVGEE